MELLRSRRCRKHLMNNEIINEVQIKNKKRIRKLTESQASYEQEEKQKSERMSAREKAKLGKDSQDCLR